MTILLIEDERKAAAELKRLIEEVHPQAVVAASLQSVEESVEWLNSHPAPELIFCDIQLADGLSFDIFRRVKVRAPIIFCTAYDEYALRAFETNGIDYLLKPIGKEKLEQSLSKFDSFKEIFHGKEDEYSKTLQMVVDHLQQPSRKTLLVFSQDKIFPLQIVDIICIAYEHGTVYARTQQQRYRLAETMEELDGQLDRRQFYRANRQFIVQRSAVVSAEHYFARKLLIKLNVKTEENIIVSKANASAFLKWLGS